MISHSFITSFSNISFECRNTLSSSHVTSTRCPTLKHYQYRLGLNIYFLGLNFMVKLLDGETISIIFHITIGV